MTTTSASVGDVTEVDKLLHGQEKTVYADAGCQGAEKRAPKRGRTWYIAAKRGSVRAVPEGELKEAITTDDTLSLISGSDTTNKGIQAKGNTVLASIGGTVPPADRAYFRFTRPGR